MDMRLGALALSRLDVEAGAIQPQDAVGEGEPNAVALEVAGVLAPIEGLEDPLDLFFGDADPLVGNRDPSFV